MSQRGSRGRGGGAHELSRGMERMNVGGNRGRGGPSGGGYRGDRGGGTRGGGDFRGGRAGGCGDSGRGGGRGGGGYGDGGRGGRGFDRGGRGGSGRSRTVVIFQDRQHPSEKPHRQGPMGWLTKGFEEGKSVSLPARKQESGPKNSELSCAIVLNHFPVMFNPKTLPTHIYRYHVDIERVKKEGKNTPQPEVKPSKKKKKPSKSPPAPENEQKLLPKEHRKQILMYFITSRRRSHPNLGIISDFSTDIYCVEPLETSGIDMTPDIPGAQAFPDEQDATFRVTITSTPDTIDLTSFTTDLNNMRNRPITKPLPDLERVYCVLMRCLKSNTYTPMNRSDLINFTRAQHKLGPGIWSYEGYNVHLPITNGWKKFINIELANLAGYIGGPVFPVLEELLGHDPKDVTLWRPGDVSKATELLETCKVQYSPQTGKKYTQVVKAVCPKSVSQTTVVVNGNVKSVYDYYRQTYKIVLNPDGPVFECKGKNSPKIPVELCSLKDGQSYNRKLNENQATKMAENARKGPADLHGMIKQAVQNLDLNNNPYFNQYGLTLATGAGMHEVNARILAPPDLMYGERTDGQQRGKRAVITPQDGEWDIWQNNLEFQFFSSQNIQGWAVINTTNPRQGGVSDDQAGEFAQKLRNKAATKGIEIPKQLSVKRVDVQDNAEKRDDNVRTLKSTLENFKNKFKFMKYAFVLVIIPKKGCQIYNHVKQAAELEVGVLTQCITVQTMSAFGYRAESILGNILLKINSKLGSVNHVILEPPKLSGSFPVFKYPVMIMGADVTHPSLGPTKLKKGETAPPSFAAVTASIDRTGMPYMMHVQAQQIAGKGSAEVIQGLDKIVEKFLKRFYEETKRIQPSKIIYFRDGVGDGQFPEVLRTEMTAIRRACKIFGKTADYEPKITFITVQKRHKTRFFLKEGTNISNAKPGTVVDTDIVHPVETDFYLLSHKGILGTSRPTRYHVLWDDSEFTMNEIQTLAYFLCYMFVRCNRSVKIPAPTYYSHWAAKRAEILSRGWAEQYRGNIQGLNRELMKRENLDCGKLYPMHFV